MILKSLDKNLKNKIRFYQNLIVFSWDSVSFKKKAENSLKSSSIFIFITLAHTTENSNHKPTKKPTNYEF